MLALMDVRIIGSNIGNAKMAVSVELLLVFEAIADTKVNIPEIPVLPKKSTQKKILMFSMGLPNKIVKKSLVFTFIKLLLLLLLLLYYYKRKQFTISSSKLFSSDKGEEPTL